VGEEGKGAEVGGRWEGKWTGDYNQSTIYVYMEMS
jgi:hypothetical protein